MEMKNGRIRNGAANGAAPGTRVIGVGGAGWHMLRALAQKAIGGISLVEVNTDIREDAAMDGVGRHQIGARVTRGLGAGGDPEVGARAAAESTAEIGDAVGECVAAVLMLGLGGGTATGAAPAIAAEARRRGARVVALCALPFEFEGPRRREQARRGLEALRGECDAVFAFENDRLARALPEDAGVEEAFGLCSEMLARMAVGLHRALACRGIMDLDPADLARVLGATDCRIAWADGSGEHRLNDALDRLLACPLLRDSVGQGVSDVVAQVTGGPEMTLADVQKITKRVRREFGDGVSVTLGALVDAKMRGQIDILLCAAELGHPTGESGHPKESQEGSCDAQVAKGRTQRNGTSRVPHVKAVRQMAPPPPPPPPVEIPVPDDELGETERREEATSGDETDLEERGLDPREAEAIAELEVGSSGEAPIEVSKDGEESPAHSGEAALFRVDDGEDGGDGVRFDSDGATDNGMVQSAFNFESPSRGRFDKTEVTMYKGEDLDIPTFMRRRMRITAVE